MINLICDCCGKTFLKNIDKNKIKRNKHFFCSQKCFHSFRIKRNKIIKHNTYAEIIIQSKIFGERKVKIDLEDVDKCKNITWSLTKKMYVTARRDINMKNPLLHRFLLEPKQNEQIDHINRDTLDNRKQNLKICNNFINAQNKSNNNQYVGICWSKKYNKWRAYISYKSKQISLGYYKNIEDAKKARKIAEIKYYNYTT